jgi:Protein of unknown function DUF262
VSEVPLQEERVIDADDVDEVVPYTYDITSFGADFTVDNLISRMNRGDIVIPTFDPEVTTSLDVSGFQREFVWSQPQMDRFIESLLLGLPVPGIFLVNESRNIYLVLDGQQRLRSLHHYYQGVVRGREFRLQNVQPQFRGLRYKDLDDEDRRRLDNSIIHATIVRQDVPSNDLSSIYLLFERLNTGGTTLQPQEIRVALYRGGFVKLLRDLNEFSPWRTLYGPRSRRLKDQELILRFFALRYRPEQYKRPMKEFLNLYMGDNREFELQDAQTLTDMFEHTTTAILEGIGQGAFRPRGAINAAVLDSVMVGVAARLSAGPIAHGPDLAVAYDQLLNDSNFIHSTVRSTADEESVRSRLELAKSTFSTVR